MIRFLGIYALFILSHVVPALPGPRRWMAARLGHAGFQLAYGVLSLALMALLIDAARDAPYIQLWAPAPWAYHMAVLLMPVVLLLLGAATLAPNPLSVAFVAGEWPPGRPGAVAITRHPILWALTLWGAAHVPANGDLVAVLLFGGLSFFGIVGMTVLESRKRRHLGGKRWAELSADTSFIPLMAILDRRARWPTDRASLAGMAAGALVSVLLLLGGHRLLFFRDPLAFF
jgi:uncharacterized membrane protein